MRNTQQFNITELKPIYSNAKSFYNKATQIEDDNYFYLVSYKTLVAAIEKASNVIEFTWNGYSTTTARHIKEFMLQHDLAPLTKKDILKQAKDKKIIEFIDTKELTDYQLLTLIGLSM